VTRQGADAAPTQYRSKEERSEEVTLPLAQPQPFGYGHIKSRVLVRGCEPTPLTFFTSFNAGGAWSRDAQSIAFASTEGGSARVWIMSAAPK
jgi:hypothetical protein